MNKKSLRNRIIVEMTSAEPEISLGEIAGNHIGLHNVKITGDLTVRFEIDYRDYAALEKLCVNRGEYLTILGKTGIVWSIITVSKRPILVCGMILFLIAAVILPRFVLFVQVDGNQMLPDNYILEAAESCGIHLGADRKEIRSEKVKNALLEKIPQLQWAGVNTRGCVAVISVREKPLEESREEDSGICRIAAARDGIITSCTALQGNLLCKEGQAVSKGQTLISSYTDCGLSIRVTAADGEVFAQTDRNMEAVLPRNWYIQGPETQSHRSIGILIGKKRINLWKDSGIWDTTCDRMYQEYYVVLPGGFRLPIGIWTQTVTIYQLMPQPLANPAAQEAMKAYINKSLTMQMVAGKVLQAKEHISLSGDLYTFHGNYICTEMIGIPQPEKIGEYYGQTN